MIVAVSGPYSHDIAQALFGPRSSTNMQSATFSYSLVNSMILLYIKILFLLSLHIVTIDTTKLMIIKEQLVVHFV